MMCMSCVSSEKRRAAEAVLARMAPPSQTRCLWTNALGTPCLDPSALLCIMEAYTRSLLHPSLA
ncbi:hypothetical protein Krac_1927 [Ktedonobacter racemifer DSM 44963]|uniref:Uncharacterized protein n=1 Tax=Ktedonobacter racemifer DSM 44963 TaxID=485913 RepID=D6U3Y7_KTERA|nr:hypothetical protein Krac_1927 [Ktedonobacter racemifer DSM 44963]